MINPGQLIAAKPLTNKQIDTLIKSGSPVTLHNPRYNETFTVIIVSRDKFTFRTDNGGLFERSECFRVTAQ